MVFYKIKNFCTKIKFFKSSFSYVEDSRNSILELLTPKKFLQGMGFTILIKITQMIGVFFIFQLVGLNFDFFTSSIIYNTSLLLGAFTFIPAGTIVTDVSMLSLIMKYDHELAISTLGVIFYRIFTLWFGVIIGFIFLYLGNYRNFLKT